MESLPIVATVELDLPLNGRWSDLEADFIITVRGSPHMKPRVCSVWSTSAARLGRMVMPSSSIKSETSDLGSITAVGQSAHSPTLGRQIHIREHVAEALL